MRNLNPCFLIADPDESVRKTLARILHELGYPSVVEASNGTEAWSILKSQGADFVISAWNMPEMSGLALLKIIRAEPKFYATPVILVAEYVTKGQVVEAGEAGVSDIILRPPTPELVRKKIEVFLQPERDPQFLAAQKSYQQGLELMEAERWDEALKEFQRVLTIYENAEVYYNMGYIKTAQGLYEEAIRYFRRATQINNAFAKAYEKMGECLIKLGRKEEATRCLEQAAEIYMEKHMDSNAESVLKEVTKLSPETINVYNSLGIIYRRRGQPEKAITQYKKALKVNPNDEHIYYNLARAHVEMKEYVQARNILKKALQLNPESVEIETLLKFVSMKLPAKLRV